MVSGSLALLYFLLGFHGGKQGSGPDRGQSPVEKGDLCMSIHPSIPSSGIWLAGAQAWLGGPEGGMDGQTNIWKIFPFYRTLSPALLPPMKTNK